MVQALLRLSAGLAVAVQETQSQQMMPETAVLEQMMDSLMEWGLVTLRLNSVIQQRKIVLTLVCRLKNDVLSV